jgi:hypothetical protein
VAGEPQDSGSPSAAGTAIAGVRGTGVAGTEMAKDWRRELRLRNSLLGDMSEAAGFAGVSAGTRLPFKLKRLRGSMDLRRLCPPLGMDDVSTAYPASSSQRFSRSQLISGQGPGQRSR